VGRIIWFGEISGKRYELYESAGGVVKLRNVTDGVDPITAGSTITDAQGVSLSSHASRHSYGGADALGDDSLRYRQIQVVFGAEQTVSVGAGSTQVIAEGMYIARCGANTMVEYSPDGTNWYTLISAGGAGLIVSDGVKVRFRNTGASAENSYLLPVV